MYNNWLEIIIEFVVDERQIEYYKLKLNSHELSARNITLITTVYYSHYNNRKKVACFKNYNLNF